MLGPLQPFDEEAIDQRLQSRPDVDSLFRGLAVLSDDMVGDQRRRCNRTQKIAPGEILRRCHDGPGFGLVVNKAAAAEDYDIMQLMLLERPGRGKNFFAESKHEAGSNSRWLR